MKDNTSSFFGYIMNFEIFLNQSAVKKEYEKAFLLNLFKKICLHMEKDDIYKTKIKQLFKEAGDNKSRITKVIVKKDLNQDIDNQQAELMATWFTAHFQKSNHRKDLSAFKKPLIKQQNGICLACGESLGTNMEEIHVDHIIPFALVGDELKDNYQALCHMCNLCKSASTDYLFRNLIGLS